MLKSIDDIIELHSSKGNIEDAYIDIHFDDTILKLNIFTLKFTTVNAEKEETRRWNNRLNFELKKNRSLEKEVKEFRILFEAINKLKVKKGYIEKTERPDFILETENKKIGIEITRIYSGNDWVPEKLYEDIKTYNIEKKEIPGYIEYRKYSNKITTYTIKENLIIKPLNKKENINDLKVKTKNKILEKVRKMFDEYNSYDKNVVIAEIVSSQFFDDINNIDKFNDELTFYINHLETNFSNKEYELLLKLDKKWVMFDLKQHTCKVI